MEALSIPIYNTEGKETDSMQLDAQVFDGKVNNVAIYQAIIAYLANQRKGQASTKTRGEVSGGGRKPWRQKGTGRARVGSTRSPLWRHGGVVFGPHPRDFSYRLPNRIKTLALKSTLNAKVKENKILLLDGLQIEKAKTKEAARIFSNLKLEPRKDKRKKEALLLLDKIDINLKRALKNLAFLDVNLARQTYAYEILSHRRLIVTKAALQELTTRLKEQC